MKLTVLISFFILTCVIARDKSLDDKLIYLDSVKNNEVHINAKSVASMVSVGQITPHTQDHYSKITTTALSDIGFCKDFALVNQKSYAKCTGFLISTNKIATAGHCISNDFDCENFRWIFNADENIQFSKKIVSNENIYNCKSIKVIKSSYAFQNTLARTDLAIIELDRDVKNISPLRLNFNNKHMHGNLVYSLGHHLGQSLKFSHGKVKSFFNNSNMYTDQLSLPGSSGSPVIDVETNSVIGVITKSIKLLENDSNIKCLNFINNNQQLQDIEFYSGITNINKIKAHILD